jgi:hypothetical protein
MTPSHLNSSGTLWPSLLEHTVSNLRVSDLESLEVYVPEAADKYELLNFFFSEIGVNAKTSLIFWFLSGSDLLESLVSGNFSEDSVLLNDMAVLLESHFKLSLDHLFSRVFSHVCKEVLETPLEDILLLLPAHKSLADDPRAYILDRSIALLRYSVLKKRLELSI